MLKAKIPHLILKEYLSIYPNTNTELRYKHPPPFMCYEHTFLFSVNEGIFIFSILDRVAYLLNHLHPSVNFPEAAVA